MKKIISALVLGAAAVGFATADLKIAGNYRLGSDMFYYSNGRESGEKADKRLFDLPNWNSGTDSLQLTASGNIFTFFTQLTPGNEKMGFKAITITANVGNFTFRTGVHGDGLSDSTYHAKKDADDGNEEGKVFQTYKPGSTLGGLSVFAINETTFTSTANNYFAQAGYKFGLGDNVNLGIRVAAISDYNWGNAQSQRSSITGDNKNDLGWSVFVQPTFKGILGAEVFAKGQRMDRDNYGFVFGGYVNLLCLPVLTHSGIGGAVGMYGMGRVSDWSGSVNLRFQLGDRMTLTTLNTFTQRLRYDNGVKPKGDFKKDIGTATNLAGLPGTFQSSAMLWDMLALRFKLNDTLAIIGTVGQQFDFDGGDCADGMQIFVHPHVQIYAASNASITVGAVAALGGIGANKNVNKNFDVLVRVPVLFRVKM